MIVKIEKLLPEATATSKNLPADANDGCPAGLEPYCDTVNDPTPTAFTVVPAVLALAVPLGVVEPALAEPTEPVGASGAGGGNASGVHELPLNINASCVGEASPTATQNDTDAHDSELSANPEALMTSGVVHELPLNVAARRPPVATQNDADTHDTEAVSNGMPEYATIGTIGAGALHELPLNANHRPIGGEPVGYAARLSTAMQNDGDEHDTELSPAPLSIVSGALHELPLNVNARPTPGELAVAPAVSTATQKEGDGHDTD